MIDLSKELRPGVTSVNGEHRHGSETRRLEIRQFVFQPDKMLMYWVDTESHVGTHVEGPNHHPKAGKCLADLPLQTFLGEAICIDLAAKRPIGGEPQPILREDLEHVRAGDIVLMWSPHTDGDSPYISPEAASFLLDRRVKMVGIQGIGLEAPGSMASHDAFLLNDIPIIEGLENLDQIAGRRVFFIGLPIRLREIDSSWIRAVALDSK